MAVAHSILIAIYAMLSDGAYFIDLGSTHYDARRRDLIAKRSVRRLESSVTRSRSRRAPRDRLRFQGKKPFGFFNPDGASSSVWRGD